ncbi:hypothetical protein BSKO_07988 [Bryopsis sp. KO-2023]|nr:hypothetical protein BSKO_07988 [Bryopsis sp. KO-2023]
MSTTVQNTSKVASPRAVEPTTRSLIPTNVHEKKNMALVGSRVSSFAASERDFAALPIASAGGGLSFGKLPWLVRGDALRGDSRRYRIAGSRSEDNPHFESPALASEGDIVPQELLSIDGESKKLDKAFTVYSLRFSTASRRGSSVSDPLGGVWVCLIGKDNKSFLQKISPIFDPEEAEDELHDICEIADVRAGANCTLALKSSGLRSSSPAICTQRFLQGSVDEVSFLGPELGPLRALMVGPESGSWSVDEITVSSSRTKHTDRFTCREDLGQRGNDGAALLTPVPADSVIYGSGTGAVTLTKGEAVAMRQASMNDYNEFKAKLLLTTAGLVAGGGALAAIVGGPDAALPFAFGGSCGFMYQWLLQKGVDSVKVPPGLAASSGSLGELADEVMRTSHESSIEKIVGTQYFRYAVLVVVAGFSFWALQSIGPVDSVTDNAEAMARYSRMQHILTAALGFLMYKVAVVGVAVSPDDDKKDISFDKRL